ncbi:MAG: hypothetical protein LBE18_03545 [Planctomycetaceae bacterium]|nr:hypothetical protein [Planctomycetaceae bacterium]
MPIRICGGQLNWCNQIGCYRIMSQFPIVIQPKQEISVTAVITPRENSISETEITLYARRKRIERSDSRENPAACYVPHVIIIVMSKYITNTLQYFCLTL